MDIIFKDGKFTTDNENLITSLDELAGNKDEDEGWISVNNSLPDYLETVFISNGKGWTAIGCRSEPYENDKGEYNLCWAASNGIIYEENGKIVAECEDDDLDVQYWHRLPTPPQY